MNASQFQDFRFAIRRLRKDATTTIAAIIALAFAIGAAVATWSLRSAVLLKPLLVQAPERLFQVGDEVQPLDPIVLGTVAAGIFALALLVSLRPALEATRVDLTRSLREE